MLATMCDTIVVVEPDRVLFAKNSDRDPNEAQLLDWQPRRTHPAGERLRTTWISIDQVSETAAVLLSRPFWMWGAEMGANEHGVVIGNEAVFTGEPYGPPGLTGMDLVRLGLERAGTATAAVEVITTLLERHGQGGGCGHEKREFTYHNSFIVADPHEAWVLETAGRHWATEHVTSGARSISNGLTIAGFAERYSDHPHTHFSRCALRRSLTESAAGRATGPGDLMGALREHGTGGWAPRYSPVTGAMSAPCMHAGGLVASSQTTGSWVANWARRVSAPGHRYGGPGAPLFQAGVGGRTTDLGPEPVDRFDDRCLWWRHEVLHRRALEDSEALVPLFKYRRTPRGGDPVARESARAGGRLRRGRRFPAALLDGPGPAAGAHDRRPPWVRRYWRVRPGPRCHRPWTQPLEQHSEGLERSAESPAASTGRVDPHGSPSSRPQSPPRSSPST